MSLTGLTVLDDPAPGAWVAPRLTGEIGTVAGTVPSGFGAYVRICHPATDGAGALTDWPTVARATGRRAHPLMQWHALVGTRGAFDAQGSLWSGVDPAVGDLDVAVLGPLCELLALHTGTPGDCYFGLWDGYAVWGRPLTAVRGRRRRRPSRRSGPRRWPSGRVREVEGQLAAPALLRHPGRDYRLLAGPLAAARTGVGHALGLPHRQSPNLMWPADQAWCVASEIDFDSTLVGGTADLVRAVVDAAALDSWPVAAGDSLRWDADLVNRP